LPEPGETVDLYIWVTMGDYRRLKGFGFDVRASVPGVVKAAESQVYNADIWDLEYDEDFGDRWNPDALLGGDLNPSGVGAAELAIASGSFGIGGGTDLVDRNDGTHGVLDTLYDTTNDAFLLQRVRFEALPGSAGLSTGLVMSIGRLGMPIDDSTIFSALPIHFGLGTTAVDNNQIGATDGSTHATIAVAAGSPGAVVASASAGSSPSEIRERVLLTAGRASSGIPGLSRSAIVQIVASPVENSARALRAGRTPRTTAEINAAARDAMFAIG
jgi:hypothetical protein